MKNDVINSAFLLFTDAFCPEETLHCIHFIVRVGRSNEGPKVKFSKASTYIQFNWKSNGFTGGEHLHLCLFLGQVVFTFYEKEVTRA